MATAERWKGVSEAMGGLRACARALAGAALALALAPELPAEVPGPEWLRANLDSPDFLPSLFAYEESLGRVDDRIAALDAFSSLCRDGAKKRAVLVREASLLELGGGYSAAALALAAALAAVRDPASDDELTLRLAALRLLSGDAEAARSLALSLAARSAPASDPLGARIVAAAALASLKGQPDAEAELAPLLASADPAAKCRIYGALDRFEASRGGEGKWRKALLAEFPLSPEALAERDPFPSAFWILGAGLPATAKAPAAPATASAAASAVAEGSPVAPSATGSAPPAPPGSGAAAPKGGSFLQVGSFASRENAETLAEALRGLGFPAEARSAARGGKSYWIVVVQAVEDGGKAASKLRDLGYESFAVTLP